MSLVMYLLNLDVAFIPQNTLVHEKIYVIFLLVGIIVGYFLKDRKNSFIQINLYLSLNSNNFNHNGNHNLSNNRENQDNFRNNGNDNANVDNKQNTDVQSDIQTDVQSDSNGNISCVDSNFDGESGI